MSKPAAPQDSPRLQGRFRLAMLLSVFAVLMFYAWIPGDIPGVKQPAPFYPRLAERFLAGHLDLGYDTAAERLARLPDPWDVEAHRNIRHEENIHDLSYYKGKLYLYFGPTPALVAFCPWRLLTGRDLSQATAVLLFSSLGFLVYVLLWWRQAPRFGCRAESLAGTLMILLLGVADGAIFLLPRPEMYEVALSCSLVFSGLFLLALCEYLVSGRRRWLACSALSFGLLLGARPSLVFGGLLLPLAVWVWHAWPKTWPQWRALLADLLLAGGLSLSLVAGLLVYNQVRFDHPLEFGQAYQLSTLSTRHLGFFTLQALPYDLFAYYLSPPGWADHFPFLMQPSWGIVRWSATTVPHMLELVVGVLWLLPACLILLPAVIRCGRPGVWRTPAARLVLFALAASLLFQAPLLLACGGSIRYFSDFLPPLLLALLWGWLWFMAATEPKAGRVRAGFWSLGLLSLVATLLYHADYRQHWRQAHPQVFQRLSRAADYPSQWFQCLLGHEPGPLTLHLRFPVQHAPGMEILVLSEGGPLGSTRSREAVVVEYLPDGQYRLSYFGGQVPRVIEGPVLGKLDTAEHVLQVRYGALFAAKESLWNAGYSEEQVRKQSTQVSLMLDGRVLIEAELAGIEPYAFRPRVGAEAGGEELAGFSGELLRWTQGGAKAP